MNCSGCALPDAWIVAGCPVQTAWNGLTSRAIDYGISDYDVFYFDADTSWAAEDAVIRKLHNAFAISASPSRRAIRRASISGIPKSTACPTRRCDVHAKASTVSSPEIPRSESVAPATDTRSMRPQDIDDIANMIVRPNPGANFSAASYAKKAARWKALWPEITVLPAE